MNETESKHGLKLFLKALTLTFAFISLCLVVSAIVIFSYIFLQINKFRTLSQLSWNDLQNMVEVAINQEPIQSDGRKNILVLGVDAVANREGQPLLTDTMMIISIDLNSGKIYSFSLPRDLWSEEYLTKINALYTYGFDRYPDEPELFPQEYLAETLQIDINNSLVISLDNLADIIDILGGVEVEVDESFVDNEFPRSDVPLDAPESELYETVEFIKGVELMNGNRALKYVRSRHSESDEGSDDARSKRQQKLINAILVKVMNYKTLANPKVMSQLYLYYQDKVDKYLSFADLTSTAKKLIPHRNQIEFIGNSFGIYPDDESGVIFHPDQRQYDGQWVYAIKDLEALRSDFKQKLTF